MRKFSYLFLIVALLVSIAPLGVMAQDDEMQEVPEVVVDRVMEYAEMIPELDHYNTIRVDALAEMMVEEDEIYFLDVRQPEEVEEFGIIEDAIHIPMRELGYNLDLLPEQDAFIVVVCKGGFRATIAMTALHILGWENAHVLIGGFDAWVGEEMPVVEEATEYEPGEMPDIDEELVAYVAEYLETLPEGWGGVKADALFEEMFEEMPDLLLDVRSPEEWADPGYIDGAEHVWINEIADNMDQLPEDKEADIVVYCASSYRGGIVATMLGLLGYENVRNLSGGINAWIAADLPVEQP